MNEKTKMDLARRAVTCPGWRWMPGMRAWWERIHEFDRVGDNGGPGWLSQALPDLDDPATLGCLLALVREAWGDPTLCSTRWDDGWRIDARRALDSIRGATEAEALVAALEAAGGAG